MDGAVLAFCWKPGHGECEVPAWALGLCGPCQPWKLEQSHLSLHFRLQRFSKKLYLFVTLNSTINTACSVLVHNPLVVLTSPLTFYLSLKTQIKTLMPVFNL